MSSSRAFEPDVRGVDEASEHVELLLPVRPELWVLARMSASAIASRLDFGFYAVEDLRLAIDELCSPLVGHNGRPGQLRLRYEWDEKTLEVSCLLDVGATPGETTRHELRPEAEEGELSDRILDALVDEHGHSVTDTGHRVWLRKRRQGVAS